MENPRCKRFNTAYKYLQECNFIHTQSDLAKMMKASVSNISSALNGVETVLTDRFLKRFNDAVFNMFSENWLLNGGDAKIFPPTSLEDATKRHVRFLEAYNYLVPDHVSFSDLASRMGDNCDQILQSLVLHPGFKINPILTSDFFDRFNVAADNIFNLAWLYIGEGPMLVDGTTDNACTNTNNATAATGKTRIIRYYPEVEGTAGGVQFLDNPDERSVEMSIPFYNDCTCAINIHGNSMAPVIKSGEIILLSEWTDRFIEWGKIYLVVTRSGYRCVKYLYPAKDDDAITCRSEDMEHYPDFNIEKEDIARLFIVKGWINRDAI